MVVFAWGCYVNLALAYRKAVYALNNSTLVLIQFYDTQIP